VILGIGGSNIYHFLKTTPGGAQQEQVICIPVSTSIVWTNLAAASGLSKFEEQIVHIKTEDDGGEYSALSDSILDGELVGGIILPSDICCLLLVNMNEDSNNDRREASINELLEQLRM
jgi:hypothetical protein